MELDQIPDLEEFEKSLDYAIKDDEVLPILEIAKNTKTSGDRFSTGFKLFDDVMKNGFKEGDLVIISGISGEGKTTFAQTLTYHLTKQSVPCLWFSYEVSISELNTKFLEMGIESHYFAYSPKINTTGELEWIKFKIKESWVKYGTKIVFIDHIDFLVPSDLKKSDNREEILKKITTQLKSLAIQLNIVIVLMAHLRKLPDNREPEMQDIGYSAGVFQLADYVFMVTREKVGKTKLSDNSGEIATNNAKIKIVKNRQTGTLKYLKLQYANGKFNEITEKYETSYFDTERN